MGKELRVGIFVALAIAVGTIMAFALGSQNNLFASKTRYHAVFDDVGGLQTGNGVRIAGVNVGTVDEVVFRDDGTVEVSFEVVNDAARLLRGIPGQDPDQQDDDGNDVNGTQALLGSKGMLGDRLIDLRPGHPSLPAWPPETGLPVSNAGDMMGMLQDVGEKIEGALANVERATETLADPQLNADVREMVGNLASFTGTLAAGDGLVQRLMTDPTVADRLDTTLANFAATSAEFRRTARSFRSIAEEVERGDGTAHALIYGDDGRQAVANIGRATGELATLMEDVRTGDGMVHNLVYENDAEDMLANLTQMTADMAAITAEMRAGHGTIGGLLVDPSIYEDVKRLVGDLERNDILRSLVRYSIRRDEAVEDPPQPQLDPRDESGP